MLNPVKRAPLSFGETPDTKNYTTIYELSIGLIEDLNQRDTDFDDPELSHKVEAFIRFVYQSFPEDYTFKQHFHFMKALKIDEVQVTNAFIERLNKRSTAVTEARLFAIFQNNSVRFWTQFIEPEREYTANLDVSGMRTQVFHVAPNENEKRFAFQLEFGNNLDVILKRTEFYCLASLDGFDHFFKYVREIYRNQSQDENFGIDEVQIRDIFATSIRAMFDKASPEYLKEGESILGQSLRVDIRIRLDFYGETYKLIATGEVLGMSHYLLEDGSDERRYESFWSLKASSPEVRQTNDGKGNPLLNSLTDTEGVKILRAGKSTDEEE